MKIHDKVYHPSLGKGEVIALLGKDEILVRFQSGSESVVKEKDCVRKK